MSHHEANKIRRKLAPFMSLLLAVACMGLLASCGGGGGGNSVTNNPYLTNGDTPIYSGESRLNSHGLPPSSDNTTTTNYDGSLVIVNEIEVIKAQISYEYLIDLTKNKDWKIVAESDYSYEVNIDKTTIQDAINYFSQNNVKAYPIYVSSPLSVNDLYAQDKSAFSWTRRLINLDAALDLLQSGYGKKIGIIDGGFFYGHEDMEFSAIGEPSFYKVKSSEISNFCQNPSSFALLEDDKCTNANHGMNVASIIQGKQNNTVGVAGVAAINLTKPVGYKTNFKDKDIADAISLLYKNGVNIINISIGSSCEGKWWDLLTITCPKQMNSEDRVNNFLRNLYFVFNGSFPKDLIIIQSSGNNGTARYSTDVGKVNDIVYLSDSGLFNSILSGSYNIDSDLMEFRDAVSKNTILVGAFNKSKNLSNFTSVPSGELRNFILAPGGSGGYYYSDENGTGLLAEKNVIGAAFGLNKYISFGGTSQAAPHVTGVAALVWMANPALTAFEVRNIILDNSDTVDGYRALNAENAVRAALPNPTISTITANNGSPTTADAVTFSASASASSDNGTITAWSWNFGDNTAASSEQSPTHTFSTAGTYTITLTVTDAKGKQASRQKTIIVTTKAVTSGTFTVNASDYPGVTFTNPLANSATCTFTATGNWRMGSQSPVTDANGNTTAVTYPNLPVGTYGYYVVPSAYAGSLVIQRSATSGELVGTSKQVTFNGNEAVKLLANDVPWPVGGFSTTAFVDNSGSMSVAYSCQ